MSVRIAVASVSLGAGFPGLIYAQLKKQVQAGQSLVECAIVTQTDPAFTHPRILALLEGTPKPIALIGICVRPDAVTLATYRAAGVPVVLIDEAAEGASTVASDNFVGGYLAGQHLARIGRRAIAVVAGEMNITGGYNALQRVKGFAKALAEHHLPFSMDDVIEVVEYTHRDGMAAMGKLLAGKRKVDAVFCAAGDACATGLLAAARGRVRVPEQVAVVGYDDNPLASLSDPPLSTIRQPLELIVREAYRLATQCVAELLARPETTLFEPTLVVRRSA